MDQELFDVILNTLTDKGHIQAWKSEILCRAVRPLYETRVLTPVKVGQDDLLKLRLLMDLLNKLQLNNTKDMLLCELDAEGVDLESGLTEILGTRAEPYLQVLWELAGYTEESCGRDTHQSSPVKDLQASQDLFETAIDLKLDEMSIEDQDREGRDPDGR